MNITPNLKINLYWRIIPSNEKSKISGFDSYQIIQAQESPIAGKGLVNGNDILEGVKNINIKKQVVNINILSVPEGINPTNSTSKIALNLDTFYNIYIVPDKKNKPSIYIDLLTTDFRIEKSELISFYTRNIKTKKLWQTKDEGNYEKTNTIFAENSIFGEGGISGKQIYEIFINQPDVDALKIIDPITKKSKSGFMNAFSNDNKMYNHFLQMDQNEIKLYVDLIQIIE